MKSTNLRRIYGTCGIGMTVLCFVVWFIQISDSWFSKSYVGQILEQYYAVNTYLYVAVLMCAIFNCIERGTLQGILFYCTFVGLMLYDKKAYDMPSVYYLQLVCAGILFVIELCILVDANEVLNRERQRIARNDALVKCEQLIFGKPVAQVEKLVSDMSEYLVEQAPIYCIHVQMMMLDGKTAFLFIVDRGKKGKKLCEIEQDLNERFALELNGIRVCLALHDEALGMKGKEGAARIYGEENTERIFSFTGAMLPEMPTFRDKNQLMEYRISKSGMPMGWYRFWEKFRLRLALVGSGVAFMMLMKLSSERHNNYYYSYGGNRNNYDLLFFAVILSMIVIGIAMFQVKIFGVANYVLLCFVAFSDGLTLISYGLSGKYPVLLGVVGAILWLIANMSYFFIRKDLITGKTR